MAVVQIADRVFVVTGASSGIGRATARALVAAGGQVALVSRRRNRLKGLVKELGSAAATAIPIDLTTGEAPERVHVGTVDAFGRLDGLINVAGRGMSGRVLDFDVETLDEAFELNLVAPIRLIQRIGPVLAEQGEGVVVNVSSASVEIGLPGIAGYLMTKAALNAMTLSLRRELLTSGVRVMTVYPGVTESEFYQHVMGDQEAETTRPPAQPAEAVARAIVRGIEQNRREVWVLSGAERRRLRMARLMGRLAPGAFDRGMASR